MVAPLHVQLGKEEKVERKQVNKEVARGLGLPAFLLAHRAHRGSGASGGPAAAK